MSEKAIASKGHYETMTARNGDKNQEAPSDMEVTNLNLETPISRLNFALRSLRYDMSPDQPYEVNNGILLFGHEGCGEAAIIQSVVTRCPKTAQVYFDFVKKSKESNEAPATVVAQEFRRVEKKFKNAVIILGEADAMLRNEEIGSAVAKELQDLLLKSCKNIYVVAHVKEPWELKREVLNAFGTKIYIPLPEEKAMAKLLKYYIEKIPRSKPVDVDVITDVLYAYCMNRNLKGVTWFQLQDAAHTAFLHACNREFSYCKKIDTDDKDKRQVEIRKVDIIVALDRIEIFDDIPQVEQKLKQFIREEKVPLSSSVNNNANNSEEDDEDVILKKINRGDNVFLWLLLACCEGWV